MAPPVDFREARRRALFARIQRRAAEGASADELLSLAEEKLALSREIAQERLDSRPVWTVGFQPP